MKYLIVLLLTLNCMMLHAQQLLPPIDQSRVPLKELQRRTDSIQAIRMPPKGHAGKTTAANYDTTTFNARINSNWGPGLSTTEKLLVFDTYWKQVDSFYSSFTGLPMYNWDSIVNAMRTEIAGGVSKGRFAGIIGRLMRYISDGHSYFTDGDIYTTGTMYWGAPIFFQHTGSYGACMTMLNDSSTMVYSAVPGNVLGLQPGDKILGYNGIPWKELVPILLKYELPNGVNPYSTNAATWHRYMCAVLTNWLMFDTLNIEKCDGSLVNFPTTVMTSANMGPNFCTEQMQVPGVQKLSYDDYYTNDKMLTWGVITGTGIGYVAMYDCGDFSGDSLMRPLKILIEDSLIDGLVIDIRTNFGGSILAFDKAFKYLSNANYPWLGCASRFSVTDRYSMNPAYSPPYVGDADDDPHFFDKKIALLVGPGAISAGDIMQVEYTHHPNLMSFGKHSSASFGSFRSIPMPYPNFGGSRQNGDFYRAEDNTFYLSHHDFPIDSFVWFDRASVCNNKDNILETAINWIKPELAVKDITKMKASARVYPNPSTGKINIVLNSPVTTKVTIAVYNVLGVETANIEANVSVGRNKLLADLSNLYLPAGAYQVVIRGKGLETIVEKVAIAK